MVSGSVGDTALTVAQMPSHNHNNGDFQYLLASNCQSTTIYTDVNCGQPNIAATAAMQSKGSGETHTHSSGSLSVSASASSTSQLPPYYTLCYIMKYETQAWVVES